MPQKTINPWSMKQERMLSALTFNYLHQGTAEHVCLWIPHFHKWINTHTGASLPGASSHLCLLTDFLSDIVVATHVNQEQNLRKTCLKDCHQPPALQINPPCSEMILSPYNHQVGFAPSSCLISEQSFITEFLTALEYSVLYHL